MTEATLYLITGEAKDLETVRPRAVSSVRPIPPLPLLGKDVDRRKYADAQGHRGVERRISLNPGSLPRDLMLCKSVDLPQFPLIAHLFLSSPLFLSGS